MTGFHLRIGYISGYTCDMSKENAFKYLLSFVSNIRKNPLIIRPKDIGQGQWSEVHERIADNYREDGPAMRALEDSVMLCCSGMEPFRREKEETAMHACIFLIRAMASLGIPVSLEVA